VLSQRPVTKAQAPTVEGVPALCVLESEAREFLIAQGIATAEAFLSTKSRAMADALMDWRARAKKERLSLVAVQNRINKWKKSVRDQQSSIPGEPLVELDAKLKILSSMARQFLSSQGIATAEAFLSTKSAIMVNALMNWRKRWDSNECSIATAGVVICRWKRRVRELESGMPGEPLVEEDADLNKLSSIARQFLSSQGIATAEAFLSTNTTTTANALIDWRRRWGSSECSIAAARDLMNGWKRRVREVQSSRHEALRAPQSSRRKHRVHSIQN
jgi:hypothetical protein